MKISISGSLIIGGQSGVAYGPNLFQKTEVLSDAYWSKTDLTITDDAIAAPTGATTAELLTAGVAGNDAHIRALTIDPTIPLYISAYLKRGNSDWALIQLAGSGAERLRGWFNLATGLKGSVSNVGAGTGAANLMQDLGDGWYRCFLSGTLGGVGSTVSYASFVAPADGNAGRVLSSTRYQWGMQLQRGGHGPYVAVA